MHTLFLLNPTAGKTDCTRTLPQQIEAAAARAGLAPEAYTIQVTTHAGHARELANAAARQARQAGETLRIYTAGGDGTGPADTSQSVLKSNRSSLKGDYTDSAELRLVLHDISGNPIKVS